MNTLHAVAATALLLGCQAYAASPSVQTHQTASAAHTKITSMLVSGPTLKAGDTLTVRVIGTGSESQCPTTVLIAYKGNNNYKVSDKTSTGTWPRVSTFVLTEPGQYLVRSLATESANLSEAEKTACGFHYSYGTSGIPGDNAVIEVSVPG